jgi:CspA family cold shock protein
MTGTIKKKTDKGFGFIESEEVEKDVFFHSSALKDVTFDELREGDAVTFEVEKTDRGLNALDVARA